MRLIFDLRGHGESDEKLGEVTAQGSLEDALAAYDYICAGYFSHPRSLSGLIGRIASTVITNPVNHCIFTCI
jgi:hypothetical protein